MERSAVGRMLRGDAEGWSVDGQGVLGRGQEVTRVRLCIIRSSLSPSCVPSPRIRRCVNSATCTCMRRDAPRSTEKRRAGERNGMRNAVGIKTRAL